MKTTSTAKYVGTSPRKIALVAAIIRGRSAADAQALLAATPKRATDPIGKVLASAIANAENNHNQRKADLRVESVLVGPAPMLDRFRPRARGSASAIKHRASHITIVLNDQVINAKAKPETVAAEAKKPTEASEKAKPATKTKARKAEK